MSFGYNSGVVSGGVGQGVAQGSKDFSANYQYNLDRQDKLKQQDREAAQNALSYKFTLFQNLKPPTAPEDGNPDAWNSYLDEYGKFETTKVSLANDIDALMGVTTGQQKNADGTPLNMQTFSQTVLGMDGKAAAQRLATSVQTSTQMRDTVTQLNEAMARAQQAATAGGTTDNPEYDKAKADVDKLVAQRNTLHKTLTGKDYVGAATDWDALNTAANKKSTQDYAMKSLGAFADDPVVASILATGKQFSFSTKLRDVGIDQDGTLGEFFKHMRGEKGFEEMVKAGDYKKALAFYMAMSPEERNASQTGKDFAKRLEAVKTDPNGDAPLYEALQAMKLTPLQVRNLQAQAVGQEQSNENNWLKRAENGDPTLLQDFEKYKAEQLDAGKSPDKIEASWQGLVSLQGKATQAKDNEFTLKDQAVKAGTIQNNTALSKMITNGDLYVMNEAGLAGDIKALYKDDKAFDAAVAKSQYWYTQNEEAQSVDLNTRKANLQSINQRNEFDKLANPLQIQLLTSQVEGDKLKVDEMKVRLKYLSPQLQLDYFGKIAETLGADALNSPAVQSLAKDLGLTDADIAPFKTLGHYSDWVKSDNQRKSANQELMQLLQDPIIASSQGGRLKTLSDKLGLDYTALRTQVSYLASQKKKLDSAQINQILTSTWATKQGVALDQKKFEASEDQRDKDNQDRAAQRQLQREQFDWSKYTWRSEQATQQRQFTMTFNRQGQQWSAEQELRVRQVEHGFNQDDFGNALSILKMMQDNKFHADSVSSQDKQTLTMFAQTTRATIDDARGQQAQALKTAQDLQEKDTYVKQAIQNGRIYKTGEGRWSYKGQGKPAGTILQYIEAMNQASDYQKLADAGSADLQVIRQNLMPQSSGNDEVKDLLSAIFGDSGAKLVTYPTAKPGQQIKLNTQLRQAISNIGGNQGALVKAALSAIDNGLTNEKGEQVENAPWRCSQTLRLLYKSAGVPVAKYFGGDAKETWRLVSKNGQVVNGGRPLNAASFSQLKPGDVLYQNTPVTTDGNGNKVDYDHVATYLGNGLVLQHNSDYQSKTGVARGDINILTIDEFSRLFPTYAGRIPELRGGGNTTNPVKTTTTGTSAKPTVSTGNVDWPSIRLPAGKYRANVTNVTSNDKLAIPSGKGTFNLITDTNTQRGVIGQFVMSANKNIAGWKTLPLEKRRTLITLTLQKQGFQGNIQAAVNDFIRK